MSKNIEFTLTSFMIIFILISSGCLEEEIDGKFIIDNLKSTLYEAEDLSYTETITYYVDGNPLNTKSEITIKNPNIYKKIDLVNSSINFISIFNQGEISGYDPMNNEYWIISNSSEKSIPDFPVYRKIIEEDISNYEMNYVGAESIQGILTYKVNMSSKIDEKKHNLDYILWIDQNNWLPVKIQSYDQNDLLLELKYENYALNLGKELSDFQLEIPKNATVIET